MRKTVGKSIVTGEIIKNGSVLQNAKDGMVKAQLVFKDSRVGNIHSVKGFNKIRVEVKHIKKEDKTHKKYLIISDTVNKQTEEFDYMWKNEVIAKVTVNYATGKAEVKNNLPNTSIHNILKLPFGIQEEITAKDVIKLYSERCFPKSRMNTPTILKSMGLEKYEPKEIVKKSHGRMLSDQAWIRFKGEELEFGKDIK